MAEQHTKTSEVRQTNLGPCYFRTFTDIPFAAEIAEAIGAREAFEARTNPPSLEFIIPFMEARYKAVGAVIKRSGMSQVVELAAGWSPRGMMMAQNDAGVNYIETDQSPEELERKRGITGRIMGYVPSNLHHVTFDVLNEEGLRGVLAVLRKEPTAVVHEGLFRYFTHEQKGLTVEKIHAILSYAGGGIYATTDIHTRERTEAFKGLSLRMGEINRNLSQRTKTEIDGNEYANSAEARLLFENHGFSVAEHAIGEYVTDFSCLTNPRLDAALLKRPIEVTRGLPIWEMQIMTRSC